ncbi:hypothetical protein CVS47_02631 [Microbacterium lemovicicum]|jgi:hypothetical protein|uniref:Uncharacterized protein n=1 Tax=Microbacterium lemovicicum TaxID=1072463 RepID=A0A3S9WD50_9MICO|nr:hypothetical protein [Microbacterium lemovicicum]AZS37981.1 hypothetical protein CVS47_02631 [Microbacterium lemovicicum]
MDSDLEHGADEQETGITQAGVTDSDGESKPGGLGEDGTIPPHPDGVAAGHTGEASHFEPEEDEAADS